MYISEGVRAFHGFSKDSPTPAHGDPGPKDAWDPSVLQGRAGLGIS